MTVPALIPAAFVLGVVACIELIATTAADDRGAAPSWWFAVGPVLLLVLVLAVALPRRHSG